MSDQNYPLVPAQNNLPAKVGKQLSITDKILANRVTLALQVNIFHVPQDGTIEEAVEKVAPGGDIKISKGVYLITKVLVIDKPLRIIGEGKSNTTIFREDDSELINVKTDSSFVLKNICLNFNVKKYDKKMF